MMCSYVDKYGLMLSVKMNSSFSLKSGLKSVRRNKEHLRSRQALMHNVSFQSFPIWKKVSIIPGDEQFLPKIFLALENSRNELFWYGSVWATYFSCNKWFWWLFYNRDLRRRVLPFVNALSSWVLSCQKT